MRRRGFICFIGAAATAWPLSARAQQSVKQRTIGFLGSSTPSAMSQWVAAFVQRLRDLGWIEGGTVTIEYRWADGRSSRAAEIAAEFVQLKVDVIVTYGTSPVLAAKQATSVIPIVFAAANDPVGAGLVASLARPTGTSPACRSSRSMLPLSDSNYCARMSPVSAVWRLWLISVTLEPRKWARRRRRLVRSASRVTTIEIRRGEDIAPGFDTLKGQVEALYVCTDPLVITNRARIQTSAMGARLPTVYNSREYVETGGLMSYGPNFLGQWRRTAEIVDKILRGAKPGDIPVEQPTKFDLVLNLTTAKVLGLTIPSTLIARADEVIE